MSSKINLEDHDSEYHPINLESLPQAEYDSLNRLIEETDKKISNVHYGITYNPVKHKWRVIERTTTPNSDPKIYRDEIYNVIYFKDETKEETILKAVMFKSEDEFYYVKHPWGIQERIGDLYGT